MGPEGLRGLIGPEGPQGIVGPQGEKGEKGDEGNRILLVGQHHQPSRFL